MRRDRGPRLYEEEGSYLASVSDLMASLIFVFIITLAVFALRLVDARMKTEDERTKYTSVPSTRAEILTRIKTELSNLDIEVEIDDEQGVLRLTEKGVFFPQGQERPATGYEANVGKLSVVLAEVVPAFLPAEQPVIADGAIRPSHCSNKRPSKFSADRARFRGYIETILIEGHTDPVPVNTVRFKDNFELSAARASKVLHMMEQCEPALGVLRNQSGQRVFSVSGYANERPADPANPVGERNRRIDVRFVMEPERDGRASVPREVKQRYE